MATTDIANVELGGGALITHDGATLYSEEAIKVSITKITKQVAVTGVGSGFIEVLLDCYADITIKVALWKDYAKLFAILGLAPGARVFGATDKPLVLHYFSDAQPRKYTWSRAAILMPPNLRMGVEKSLFDTLTFRCLKANATNLSSANSMVTLATNATAPTINFDISKRFDIPFFVTHGDGSILGAAETEAGVDIDFNVETREVKGDQSGVIDYVVKGMTAEAKFTPFGLSAVNALAFAKAQGTGVTRGTRLNSLGGDLLVAGALVGDPSVTIAQMHVLNSGLNAHEDSNLLGEFSLKTTRKLNSGALGPLATFGVVAA